MTGVCAASAGWRRVVRLHARMIRAARDRPVSSSGRLSPGSPDGDPATGGGIEDITRGRASMPDACLQSRRRQSAADGLGVASFRRNPRASAPRLGQADRHRLLAVRHFLPRASGPERAAGELVHYAFHLSLRRLAVSSHVVHSIA